MEDNDVKVGVVPGGIRLMQTKDKTDMIVCNPCGLAVMHCSC